MFLHSCSNEKNENKAWSGSSIFYGNQAMASRIRMHHGSHSFGCKETHHEIINNSHSTHIAVMYMLWYNVYIPYSIHDSHSYHMYRHICLSIHSCGVMDTTVLHASGGVLWTAAQRYQAWKILACVGCIFLDCNSSSKILGRACRVQLVWSN